MAIKDVLAIVEPGERAASLLEVAASLALRQGAHLTGLCVVPPLMLSEAGLPWAGGPVEAAALDQVRASLHGTHAAAVQQLEAAFRKAAADLVAPTEWRTAEGRPAELAPLHARYADLTVVGQQDPENPVEAGAGVIEALLLGSGRPVLIVPYAGRFAAVGRTVLVAWNASREAARAVNDALPLLEQADAVKVLAVNPGRSGDEEPRRQGRCVLHDQRRGRYRQHDPVARRGSRRRSHRDGRIRAFARPRVDPGRRHPDHPRQHDRARPHVALTRVSSAGSRTTRRSFRHRRGCRSR